MSINSVQSDNLQMERGHEVDTFKFNFKFTGQSRTRFSLHFDL